MCATKSGKVIFLNRFNNDCEAVIQCHRNAVHALAFLDGRFYTGGEYDAFVNCSLFFILIFYLITGMDI
jgi:hypothetical protein